MIKRQFTLEEARIVGDNLGLDWNRVDLSQFRLGLNIEFCRQLKERENVTNEDDPFLTGRIVLKRLSESSEYYDRQPRPESVRDSLF
jgi:hypothetical protein